jgi:hypothetical protein
MAGGRNGLIRKKRNMLASIGLHSLLGGERRSGVKGVCELGAATQPLAESQSQSEKQRGEIVLQRRTRPSPSHTAHICVFDVMYLATNIRL